MMIYRHTSGLLRVLAKHEHCFSFFIAGKETDGPSREAETLAKLLQQAKLQAVDASRLQINEQTNRLIHPKTTWAELKV